MNKKVDKTYATALELSKAFDENFIELAATLRDLNESDADKFRDFISASGIGRRKAYYLVKVDRTFRPLKIPAKVLREIGWTKLMILTPHVTKQNVHELLDYAKTHTAKEIEAYVKGGAPEDNAHSVLLYFSDENYEQLVDALVEHGAKRKGRGLEGKEQALMRLLASKKN